jgi:signal transduction histidine kinase
MNLQAKLTLWYVLLAVVIVSAISAVYLATDMQQQFEATLNRADAINTAATVIVKTTLNSQLKKPLREALRDPALQPSLVKLLTAAQAIVEIAVVDAATNEILAASRPESVGTTIDPSYPDFRSLAQKSTGWWGKLKVLRGSLRDFYELEQQLGSRDKPDKPELAIRVIIAPVLIRAGIEPTMQAGAEVAVVCVIVAIFITFIFSAIAFRPLGELRHQLDLVTRGELPADTSPIGKPGTDELSIMASKVSLLGERLRGAQFEVSDLRGNIDHLLQDLEDAVFIFNRERRLVFASGSVEKFLGKDRADFAGQTISDIFSPSTTLGLLIAQGAQTGRPSRNRRVPVGSAEAGGPAVVLLSVDLLETVPGGSNSGSGILVRLRDPEAQRKIGRELQTADRLAAISKISGGVAHEVKNPLNAMLLHVEVAKSKLARGDTDLAPQMEIISREILRLDRVVRTFLDFTRPVELKLDNVPLQQFMEEIVELARPQADAAKIRVNVDQQVEGVEVRMDRDLLKQAILNIVVNAMQAMPDGGELRLEASAAEDTAEIRVSDTGPGIPPDLRDKIFRLYFTTRKDGSGIGLAMAFRFVQLHDGTIDFTSEPGKGTTFSIRLPIAV